MSSMEVELSVRVIETSRGGFVVIFNDYQYACTRGNLISIHLNYVTVLIIIVLLTTDLCIFTSKLFEKRILNSYIVIRFLKERNVDYFDKLCVFFQVKNP